MRLRILAEGASRQDEGMWDAAEPPVQCVPRQSLGTSVFQLTTSSFPFEKSFYLPNHFALTGK